MPCGGLGGIGECTALDIECAAAGEVPRFFLFAAKKIPVNCCFHRGGLEGCQKGTSAIFSFSVSSLIFRLSIVLWSSAGLSVESCDKSLMPAAVGTYFLRKPAR